MTITKRGNGFVELELDILPALRKEILGAIDEIKLEPLRVKSLSDVPDQQGVYFLYYRPKFDEIDIPVYVGKTDADAGLKKRLLRHSEKLNGRVGISPIDVYFRAVRLFVFTPMDIEDDLIKHFGGVKSIRWNGSGFGSNDPGKERDTTNYKADHFDTWYPIDYKRHYFDMPQLTMTVGEAMTFLKNKLPFNLRFQRPIPTSAKSFEPEFLSTSASFLPGMSAEEQIAACISVLPPGWHATALPSHIIVYKNDKRTFPSGTQIAKS